MTQAFSNIHFLVGTKVLILHGREVFMGRPFYPHEAEDPDLDWLVTNFLYERSDFVPVETEMLPLILMPYYEGEAQAVDTDISDVEVPTPRPAAAALKKAAL